MQKAILACILIVFSIQGQSQETILETTAIKTNFKTKNKGKLFFYWGWNKAQYSYSDITFKGDDYNFTLYNIAAKDRQNPWDADIYLNATNISIPQTVARIGYFFHDNWNFSVGFDHMKYVMIEQQPATIDGYIDLNDPVLEFNGVYNNEYIYIDEDFLEFELLFSEAIVVFNSHSFEKIGTIIEQKNEIYTILKSNIETQGNVLRL